MLRRAASGHIEATQLSKFAAASRIALAVISGWPEAPSSPLQGSGALLVVGAACGCAEGAARWRDGAAWLPLESFPVKMLSKKLSGPPPDDCASASPHISSAAAITAALVPLMANCPVRRFMYNPQCPKYPGFRRPRHGFQWINKARFCYRQSYLRLGRWLKPPFVHLCSHLQTGYN